MTLFARADSGTSAALAPEQKSAARQRPAWGCPTREPDYLDALEQRARDFDVDHSHTDSITSAAGSTARRSIPQVMDFCSAIHRDTTRSTSSNQGRATVPYDSPGSLIPFINARSAGYLLFTNDISADTCADVAIDIARRVAMPLKIAGTLLPENQRYFACTVAPALARCGTNAELNGKLQPTERSRLLAGARALLVPGTSADTVGMAMIEGAACGTPVIAFHSGAAMDTIGTAPTGAW